MSSALTTTQSHELMKAFLYIHTASIAITNIQEQMTSTEAYIQYNSINGYYTQHCEYQEEWDEQKRDLDLWQERWVQAAVAIVDGFAMKCLGRGLPGEILDIVGRDLRRGDMVLDPLR